MEGLDERMFIADLHTHSKYSRATSKQCVPEYLDLWARRKGLDVLGAGDFTHRAWRSELKEKLIPGEDGFYRLRETVRLEQAGPTGVTVPRFVVSGEISTIYKKNGRTRKVHSVILLPSLEAADRLSGRLEQIGNLHSDGRPILGLDCRDLLEITLETCRDAIFIPAHVWTPHFSVFGAYSGFDTLEECFEDLTCHIHALETGLSSDPAMNWRVSALDRYTLVSNSDAHSPANLAREANIFETEPTYWAMARALADPQGRGFGGTLEFFPEEGKYHYDGHRNCKLCLRPEETAGFEGRCPHCGGRITLGVLHRIEGLADRPEGFVPAGAKPYEQLIPLREMVASALGMTVASKKVQSCYDALIEGLGSELDILRILPLEGIKGQGGALIAEGIRRLRLGQVEISPGYDGEYGKISVLSSRDRAMLQGQLTLLEDVQKKAKSTPKATKAREKQAGTSIAKPRPEAVESSNPYGLNPAQWEAVRAPERVVAVIAGPGTGKTRTLVCRIAHLIQQCGVAPEDITAVTFTHKAAGEVRARLEQHFGGPSLANKVRVGTFHSICLKLLREAGQALALLNEGDCRSLFDEILRDMEGESSLHRLWGQLSLLRNGSLVQASPQLAEAARLYQERLDQMQAIDFDGLLQTAAEVACPAEGFAHLLVDEFQDTNPVQYQLIQAWTGEKGSLFVIGDPNQAIYGFRGSDPSCFERLRTTYPELRQLQLTDNYRSKPAILQAAQSLMVHQAWGAVQARRSGGEPVQVRPMKNAFEEAYHVAKEISHLVGGLDMHEAHPGKKTAVRKAATQGLHSFSDIVVLYRTNRQARLLEKYLREESIPYVVAGRERFLNEAPVRGALAFFRLMAQPGDIAALELFLRLEGFYETEDQARLCQEYAAGECNLARLQSLATNFPCLENLGRGQSFPQLIGKYGPRIGRERPGRLVEEYAVDLGRTGLESMEKLYGLAVTHERMEDVLLSIALGREGDALRSGSKRYTLDAVSLMTFHAAKGLEFPVAFLCGLQEGVIPYDRRGADVDRAEERRLLYVGITRAQDALYLLTREPESSFLAGMDGAALERFPRIQGHQEPTTRQMSFLDG